MSPRALGVWLFVSLALNLFLVGSIVGGLVIGHRLHQAGVMGPHMAAHPLWAAADGLAPEHRAAYRALLRDQALPVAQQIRQARRARREAWAGLTAQPVDAAAINRQLTEARALEMQARGDVEARIVGFAATLPPEERARLADGLAHSNPAPRAGMRRMMGPGGEPPAN